MEDVLDGLNPLTFHLKFKIFKCNPVFMCRSQAVFSLVGGGVRTEVNKLDVSCTHMSCSKEEKPLADAQLD